MSFLDQLLSKRKRLHKTQTLVTYADGRRYLESADHSQPMQQPTTSLGYVIDTQPDNHPAHVTRYVYLGSQDCCDPDILQNHKIKYVLSIGVQPASLLLAKSLLKCRFVECLDLPETNIVILLNECIDFIDAAIAEGKNILIHCNAGVSRSAAIVIGYLMIREQISYENALQAVKNVRSCICPNQGFVKQLQAFDKHK